MGASLPSAATLLTQLVASLHEESDALVAGDGERLAAVAERKAMILRALEPALTGNSGDSTDERDTVIALRPALEAAKELNLNNGRILAARMHVNRARLDALAGSASDQAIYGAQGMTVAEVGRANASMRKVTG